MQRYFIPAIIAVVVTTSVRAGTVLHVSPTGGPYQTLPAALAASRTAKRPVTIYLHGGTYFLDQTVELGPQDSGLAIAAYKNEQPVLSGGRRITGWQQATGAVWFASVPAGWEFRELWVNGQRRTRARHPNTGYFKIAAAPTTPQWNDGQTEFQFRPGDLKAWPSITNAELLVFNRWTESRLPITAVDEASNTVHTARRSVYRLEPGDMFYLEGARAALDAPGEWCLEAGKLFYWPLPGEDLSRAEVVAPALSQLVRLDGAERITFRGVTFAHAEWNFPPDFQSPKKHKDAGGFGQAAFGVPGAVFGEGARGCVFERCTFERLGNYGLELARDSQSNRVVRCEFRDLGAGGIKLGEPEVRDAVTEQSFGNEISDCRIYDGGKMFASAVGIWLGQSHDNRIVHNLIHDFYYTGISIGWTWGYGAAQAGGNRVEWNHVHHIGKLSNGDGPIISDMGGIYTLGKQPGTVIRNNLWHDIDAVRYGGWGIYFDEGTSDVLAENNLVYRTKDGGFHQHYGKENVVRNNIFAFAREHQLRRSRTEEHQSFTFEHNIVYWTDGALLKFNKPDKHPTGIHFDYNLYYNAAGKPIDVAGMSFADWQKLGQDQHSLVANPLFVAPQQGDFRLRWNSPAGRIGFRKFDLRAVGPRN